MSFERTLARLPSAAADYAQGIFAEHWAEAAWLYERRETQRLQGGLISPGQWLDVEARAEAHVDALMLGGRLVMAEHEARALEGEVGELHTAIRLLARTDGSDRFGALALALPWDEPLRAAAVVDALVWDAPASWKAVVGSLLASPELPEAALGPLARVAGLRGWSHGDALVALLQARRGDALAIVDAVTRLELAAALPALVDLVEHAEDAWLRSVAAMGALRFDPRWVLARLERSVESEPWASLPMAMSAGQDALPRLLAAHKHAPGAPEPLLALGIFGHVDALDRLLAALDHEDVAWAAAEALELITGANLYEEALEPIPALGGSKAAQPDHTPTEPDDDEPAEPPVEPAEAMLVSEAAPPPEDDPAEDQAPDPGADPDEDPSEDEDDGMAVLRPSRSRKRWAAWLAEHSAAFTARQLRHRHGAPFLPARSLDALASTHPSLGLRELVAIELAIRYGIPLACSPQLLVPQQREALRRIRAHLEGQRVVAGAWARA
jgi:hypothetical protein